MRFLLDGPAWALIAGATIWGVVWYPYRLLAARGVDGIWATLFTFGFALVVGLLVFRRAAASLRHAPPLAWLMAAAIGWSNLGFVVAILEGEVVRVLLLFYLAPLWTVPIARVVLGESLDIRGAVVMALAFTGALTMLWRPELGSAWPVTRAEWLGVGAGFLFALGNVLVRRVDTMTDVAKSLLIWAGVCVAAIAHLPSSPSSAAVATGVALDSPVLIAAIGLSLGTLSIAIQYGLARMSANRAIVILLFELVVAAASAHLLAGERLRAQDWIGGAFIVAATLATVRRKPAPSLSSRDFDARP